MGTIISLFFLGAGIVEWRFRPRLDFTRDGKLLLHYGRTVRRYKILIH